MIRFTLGALALAACLPTAGAAERPNIILIMADDLGYETIGANGGESYKTPHLDRLAATGMRFEKCFAQPLCTPTRVQIMTGMSNIRNYKVFGQIDPKATTFANLLRDAGYATGIAGKWQLGSETDLPQRLGFDEACLWQHTRRPPRYANPGLEYNGQERDFTNGEYGPKLVNDFALEFVTKHKDEPFLLYYPMILTHSPYPPTPDSPEWDPTAVGESRGKDPKHFGDMVQYMDKMIGRLVAKLDELGIRDNTLVLFLGDNGTGVGVVSQFKGKEYAGGKGRAKASGMHVPMIANWPDRIAGGQVNDNLVDTTDFLPTLCGAAGVEIPDSLTIDGLSFLPQLLGKDGPAREWIYVWYGRDGGEHATNEFAMDKRYKLLRGGRFYDLAKDPDQQNPMDEAQLTGSQAEAARKLREAMKPFANARPDHLKVKTPRVFADPETQKKRQAKTTQKDRQAKRKARRERP